MKKYLTHLNKYQYLWSFAIPTLIVLFYFIARKTAPFGNSTILTVDLGQQYIDFFSYFRESILHNHSGLIYSFSNGLGDSMISTLSYYLLSPFNLILLIFSKSQIASATFFIIILKFGFSGLSFSYLLSKAKVLNGNLNIAFSVAYALNGWIIANNLNIIWLDAMIMLPLIVLEIINIVDKKKFILYIISFSIITIINYYMAYMIGIFSLIFIIYYSLSKNNLNFKLFFQWIIATLISALISLFVTLPNLISMMSSKANYHNLNWNFSFDYSPIKFIAKLIPGSFNFDQMPGGTPNIFIGQTVLIIFLIYFFNKKIDLRTKILNLSVTLFLILSMMFKPLDLIWHAFQYPIWYPYRFSYIFCFWIILTAAYSIKNISNLSLTITNKIWISIITIIPYIYLSIYIKQFNFISYPTLIVSFLFNTIVLIILFTDLYKGKNISILILFLITFEMATNLVLSLNNITYLNNNELTNSTNTISKSIKSSKYSNDFFRTSKNFERTKNDGLNSNYNGASVFSSLLKENQKSFMKNIGNPSTSTYIDYTNGTIISDGILSMKYLIDYNSEKDDGIRYYQYRYDENSYKFKKNISDKAIYENKYALPIAFKGNSKILSKNIYKDPIKYQSAIINNMTNHNNINDFYKSHNFNGVKFNNIKSSNKITGNIFKKENILKNGTIDLSFSIPTNDSYYLTMGNEINKKNVNIIINNKQLPLEPDSDGTKIYNIASNQKGNTINIRIHLKKNSIWLQNFTLYSLNNKLIFDKLNKLKSNKINLEQANETNFNGKNNLKHKSFITTTIPYDKGWKIKVNNKNTKIYKWSNNFIAFKLPKGKSEVNIKYSTPFAKISLVISLSTIILLSIIAYKKRRY
ncbi:YfhO family protein [Lactobacillus sp. S2-2]|uniref:YfhO family protein n=1 Tax=Lactobacillus sp. S2-2 TaxID=2692917 RepID=UPI001F1E4FEC|nr:YfhO family protein [Lactobacillus sp. S2-2]MCF6515127.1 YfhO family protein [Lactobacillus sp. S2-2]